MESNAKWNKALQYSPGQQHVNTAESKAPWMALSMRSQWTKSWASHYSSLCLELVGWATWSSEILLDFIHSVKICCFLGLWQCTKAWGSTIALTISPTWGSQAVLSHPCPFTRPALGFITSLHLSLSPLNHKDCSGQAKFLLTFLCLANIILV